jgi:hypothetical protein
MSANHMSSEIQVSGALLEIDDYSRSLKVLMKSGPNSAAYSAAAEHMDRIRLYCSASPTVSASLLLVVISHAELMHHLWIRDLHGRVLLRHLQALCELRRTMEEDVI